MSAKHLLLLILFIILPACIIHSQEGVSTGDEIEQVETVSNPRPDFWLGLGAETALYSASGLAFGGSFALGYGSGSMIGFKSALYFTEEGIDVLELGLLLRLYLFGKEAYRGPFIQIIGGTSLFNRSDGFAIPSNLGMINAGLSFGWRFIFIERFFAEPAIRAGYPYFWGANISAGIRF
jgi:hypothetical protein